MYRNTHLGMIASIGLLEDTGHPDFEKDQFWGLCRPKSHSTALITDEGWWMQKNGLYLVWQICWLEKIFDIYPWKIRMIFFSKLWGPCLLYEWSHRNRSLLNFAFGLVCLGKARKLSMKPLLSTLTFLGSVASTLVWVFPGSIVFSSWPWVLRCYLCAWK